ncbi:MAG TPA: nuclear transport factor 2 family protein [Bryobacteraceae bacterium]|jgi:predicted SnoaL-like aldol condensation-catalyzing enzyme
MTILSQVIALAVLCAPVFAALPVVSSKDETSLLKSHDKALAANKKLVYDFYRIVLRARRLDQAEHYMRVDYIQHNPNADTGIAGFKAYFEKLGGPLPIKDTLGDLVSVQAEGDMVTLSLVREYDEPGAAGKKYTSTWFDMFRIQDGKIAEHWDNATKPVPAAK